MTEKITVLSRPLVVGHKRDGRCCYDREAKRALIEACLQPGVSVARMALEHGINANLLRKWISRNRGPVASDTANAPDVLPAFSPVVAIAAPEPTGSVLSVVLPNGVKLEMRDLTVDDLPPLLSCLAGLPCSALSPD